MQTENRPIEITAARELSGFEYGRYRGVLLNLGLDAGKLQYWNLLQAQPGR